MSAMYPPGYVTVKVHNWRATLLDYDRRLTRARTLDLAMHGGPSFEGIAVRVAQRILTMAAAIWHNHKTSQPITRSLIAYDH